MAEEADRLAAIVSYGRDKARLKQQAESWRERASTAEREAAIVPAATDRRRRWNVLKWLRGCGGLAGAQV